jgi:mRNA-degrading endonuclease RelE of RelBE toxin-antitoxin system
VISHTTKQVRDLLAELPKEIKSQAKEAFVKFQRDPYHPGLHFKRVHSRKPIYSVRISRDYRAIGVLKDGEIIWFWIGSHTDYETVCLVGPGMSISLKVDS